MLFNPDWSKQRFVVDPFGLDTLIEWLEHQPPDEHYDYRNCHGCLLAQYFREQGFDDVEVSKNFVKRWKRGVILSVEKQEMLPPFFNWIAEEGIHTFGDALKRATIARDDPKRASRLALAWL